MHLNYVNMLYIGTNHLFLVKNDDIDTCRKIYIRVCVCELKIKIKKLKNYVLIEKYVIFFF